LIQEISVSSSLTAQGKDFSEEKFFTLSLPMRRKISGRKGVSQHICPLSRAAMWWEKKKKTVWPEPFPTQGKR